MVWFFSSSRLLLFAGLMLRYISNAPSFFTIHGLWPDYNDGTWPACCTRSNFDEKEISTLGDAMHKYWPSLSCGSPSTCHGTKGSFWAHEWEKHGTCSSPVFQDEYNYFLTTLNVYFKYNVSKVLAEAGYVPSNTEKYPLGGIVSAIENAFHATPELACSRGEVEELYICFYKDFKPRSCATRSTMQNLYSKSSCPKYVSLPEHVSLGLDGSETIASGIAGSEALSEILTNACCTMRYQHMSNHHHSFTKLCKYSCLIYVQYVICNE